MIKVGDIVLQYRKAQHPETRYVLRTLLIHALAPRPRRIFDYIQRHPGCTTSQLSKALGMPSYNVTTLVAYLKACDLVIADGSRPQRLTVIQRDTTPEG